MPILRFDWPKQVDAEFLGFLIGSWFLIYGDEKVALCLCNWFHSPPRRASTIKMLAWLLRWPSEADILMTPKTAGQYEKSKVRVHVEIKRTGYRQLVSSSVFTWTDLTLIEGKCLHYQAGLWPDRGWSLRFPFGEASPMWEYPVTSVTTKRYSLYSEIGKDLSNPYGIFAV